MTSVLEANISERLHTVGGACCTQTQCEVCGGRVHHQPIFQEGGSTVSVCESCEDCTGYWLPAGTYVVENGRITNGEIDELL